MQRRAHLFSLQLGHALRATVNRQYYSTGKFAQDLLAGLTVGIISIPLSMALAIGCGVAPQYGLYSAIVGSVVIALTGGSRFSVAGPTAVFVVLLYPIVQQYGLAGLLLTTMLSGLFLVLMAVFRCGRFIEYIPAPVTLGFTAGIAVLMATLQLNDLLGLALTDMPGHYWQQVNLIGSKLVDIDLASVVVAVFTLLVLWCWPKLKTVFSAHVPAVIAGSLLAILLSHFGWDVATIGSRFHYIFADGSIGSGIPSTLPNWQWPWARDSGEGYDLRLSWKLLSELLPVAFAIAILTAIESLVCAVVLDGMTGKRHSANSELLGLGIGNIVVPFFGGITASAALARSIANVKAGAQSPIAAVVHGVVVLVALLYLAPILAQLPMPTMAALLLGVAWDMLQVDTVKRFIKTAPRSDLWVFFICFSFTVLFDMVLAITAGILLATLLFMKEIADMVKVTDITSNRRLIPETIPAGWRVFKINGPLFFAAADRVFAELAQQTRQVDGIVLYLDGVPLLDAGGLSAMEQFIKHCQIYNTQVIFCDLQFQPLKTLARAGVKPIGGVTSYSPTLHHALQQVAQI